MKLLKLSFILSLLLFEACTNMPPVGNLCKTKLTTDYHTVVENETALANCNGLKPPHTPKVGQQLKIKCSSELSENRISHVIVKGDNLYRISKRYR
ncbi:LysM peptidoglycan-binding domain-containing protein, partial [Thiotrichales bacterium HSG1]|nr:LysM peptidoglycan-binding domain-containing protein [Thiotrichales bacterium HSG1]